MRATGRVRLGALVAVTGLVTALGVAAPPAQAADSGTYESPGCTAFNRDATANLYFAAVSGAAFDPGDTITFGSGTHDIAHYSGFMGNVAADGTIANVTDFETFNVVGLQAIPVLANTNWLTISVEYSWPLSTLGLACHSVQQYDVSEFTAPVDAALVVNRVKAGSTVPMKFAVTNEVAAPITNLTTADVSLVGGSYACGTAAPVDDIENTVSASLAGTLQNNGDGTYQYNVKIDRAWAGTCRSIGLKTIYGGLRSALFQIK
jgi:hypothetical protein